MSEALRKELVAQVDRMRPGYEAFCCLIDLLGIRDMLLRSPSEASQRLNDLQQAFAEAFHFFPGGKDYRVCFAGDSVFVVKELPPEDHPEQAWPGYCGHLFAVCSILQNLELGIGNPGIRAIASYGQVSQVWKPDTWRDPALVECAANWLVLTGASEALLKCTEAEGQGRRAGFQHGYFWHEDRTATRRYCGTRITNIDLSAYGQPDLYAKFFIEMCQSADLDAALTSTSPSRAKTAAHAIEREGGDE